MLVRLLICGPAWNIHRVFLCPVQCLYYLFKKFTCSLMIVEFNCILHTFCRVKRERNQQDATNLMFIIKLLSQHVSGNFMPIIRRTRPCTTACGVLHWLCWLWLCGAGSQAVCTVWKLNLVLLKMGIMIPEKCWDKSLTINVRLVASCWFLSLHPTFMMHGHKGLKYILQLKFPLNNTMLSSVPTKAITVSSCDQETCLTLYVGKNWDQVTKVFQTTVSAYKRVVTFVLTLGLSIKFICFPFFKANGSCHYHYIAMLSAFRKTIIITLIIIIINLLHERYI